MKTLMAVIGILTLIGFYILNLLSGAVSAIWLLVIGEWKTVVLAFLFSIGMPFAFSIASLPSMFWLVVVAGASDQQQERFASSGDLRQVLLMFPMGLYNFTLIMAWTLFVFAFMESRIGGNLPWPFLLCAYSLTMTPLAYMSYKDSEESIANALAMLSAIIASFVLFTLFIVDASMEQRVFGLATIAVVGSVLAAVMGLMKVKEQERNSVFDRLLKDLDDPA